MNCTHLARFPSLPTLCMALAIAPLGVSHAQQSPPPATPLFHPNPKPGDKKPWNVRNLGTVGIGIDLTAPGFTMVIRNVETGSPAEKTGKLKPGQVIESINGRALKEGDPRIILGDLITEAEATDGKVRLDIKGQGEVTVSIPVMGRYSGTWPLDCPKSDKIVRGMADVLAKRDKPSMGGIVFLLSTGEEKDLAVVRRWMKDLDAIGAINWHRGYMGPGVCEYYLRTGDASVLPAIRSAVVELEKYIFNGSWGGRTGPAAFTYSTGTGALHAAGVHCMTFLLMAKMCGVEVDEKTLQESLTQFYRFAGHGNVAYGDGAPEGGFTDNGKHSGLALAMQAAVLLTPDGESSVYAKARDNSAMKAFYATNWFHAAHTGGGLGEIWHHWAMSMMSAQRPIPYRSYLDTRRWVMDLSRRHDGSIGIAGMTDRYDVSVTDPLKDTIDFGTFFALTYTLPRKHLQLYGAPRSKFAKAHKLPERPWGNEADDIFLSNEYVENPSFGNKDLMAEKVPTDSSFRVFQRVGAADAGDETLMQYMYHPEIALRVDAIRVAVSKGRADLVAPLLKSDDARLRHLGTQALAGMFKGAALPAEKITPEMWGLIGNIIESESESWWVTQDAIGALSRADSKTIAKHKDRLFDLLENRPCSWTQSRALSALAKVSADPAHYQTTLARTLDASTKIWNNGASYSFNRALKDALSKAPDEVKGYAAPLVQKAYAGVPPKLVYSESAIQSGADMRQRISDVLGALPGGSDFIRTLPKKTLVSTRNGDENDRYVHDKLKPDPRFVGRWQVLSKRYGEDVPDQELEKAAKETSDRIERTKHKSGRSKGRPSYLIIENNGSVHRDRNRFWSGDLLIYNDVAEARRMQIRKVGGKEYLLVENGGFGDQPVGKDWHPGYTIHIKAP